MPRFQYRCEECGGTVPAERVEKRTPMQHGSSRTARIGGRAPMAVIATTLICEADGADMVREEYTPARREVRPD